MEGEYHEPAATLATTTATLWTTTKQPTLLEPATATLRTNVTRHKSALSITLSAASAFTISSATTSMVTAGRPCAISKHDSTQSTQNNPLLYRSHSCRIWVVRWSYSSSRFR